MYKLFILFFSAIAFFKSDDFAVPYQLNKPAIKLILPNPLHEISGITIIDSNTVACIQDENGIVYIYDLKKASIKKQVVFAFNGDYEGIAKVNNTLYVLRSDGVIFEIENYTAKTPKVKEYKTGIPALNNEGLCYDIENNRLLIGAKGKITKDPVYKNQRIIYEFSLSTKKLGATPLYNFNIVDINLFAKINGIIFKTHKNKKGDVREVGLKFNTSEIAIHPITKQLYILSANDHCFFIYNQNGQLEHIEQFDPIMFNKAEGLAFYTNGDMLISNEGQAHQPTLLRFSYKP